MKKYINFYFDESGSGNSEFFTVGGFYLISTDRSLIQSLESKISSNVLKTEKAIKKYRQQFETHLSQFINPIYDSEVKWNLLSPSNKRFLISELKEFGQNNISMTSNLKRWKSVNGNKINLEAIYNIMASYLIERTLNQNNVQNDDDIEIRVYIDQRKVTPKIKGQSNKFEPLKSYITTTWFKNNMFLNSTLDITQYDSAVKPLIRYSDFFVGLVNSMCRFLNGSNYNWDASIDEVYSLFHRNHICKCYATIKNQCPIITKLVDLCASLSLKS